MVSRALVHPSAGSGQRVPAARALVLDVVCLAPLLFGPLWTPQLWQLFLLGVGHELSLVGRSIDWGIGLELILLIVRLFGRPTDVPSLELARADLVTRSGVLLADHHRLTVLDLHGLAADRRVLVLIR
jgi:hypothetical protein